MVEQPLNIIEEKKEKFSLLWGLLDFRICNHEIQERRPQSPILIYLNDDTVFVFYLFFFFFHIDTTRRRIWSYQVVANI